jgi:CxxC-x17-CxxC domain-containing protein
VIGSALMEGCHDCWFCFDMKGCSDCVLSFNLRNKKYCIRNKQYTKEEYFKRLHEFEFQKYNSFQGGWNELKKLVQNEAIHKSSDLINCENSIGDHLKNCKNMYNCFDLQDSEDCSYCAEGDAKSCVDCNNVYYKPELCNELVSALQTYKVLYSMFCFYSQDFLYCDSCSYSHDLFGCVGLQHKEYCILNKQYSKEEYEKLRLKIIGHMKHTGEWGQFFPAKFSPFGYNETVANEYYPLTKEDAIRKGFKWLDPDKKDFKKQTYLISDDITQEKDDILLQVLACNLTGKNYKIQDMELQFYKQNNIPIPRMCPDERHKERMQFRNPRELWVRTCKNCGKEMHNSFAPTRPETVYCEECYTKAIN